MINLIDIAPAFSFVVSKGLTQNSAVYNSQEFGNATLVMVGLPFSLRFERDRGEVFVDVGNDMTGWHKLEYVLGFLDSSVTQQQLGEPPAPAVLADLLQEHWEKVECLFNNQQEIEQLQAFAKQNTANLLSKIFGG